MPERDFTVLSINRESVVMPPSAVRLAVTKDLKKKKQMEKYTALTGKKHFDVLRITCWKWKVHRCDFKAFCAVYISVIAAHSYGVNNL